MLEELNKLANKEFRNFMDRTINNKQRLKNIVVLNIITPPKSGLLSFLFNRLITFNIK
jgi:phosphate/sulfate permease